LKLLRFVALNPPCLKDSTSITESTPGVIARAQGFSHAEERSAVPRFRFDPRQHANDRHQIFFGGRSGLAGWIGIDLTDETIQPRQRGLRGGGERDRRFQ
jgi:hypothetical protein